MLFLMFIYHTFYNIHSLNLTSIVRYWYHTQSHIVFNKQINKLCIFCCIFIGGPFINQNHIGKDQLDIQICFAIRHTKGTQPATRFMMLWNADSHQIAISHNINTTRWIDAYRVGRRSRVFFFCCFFVYHSRDILKACHWMNQPIVKLVSVFFMLNQWKPQCVNVECAVTFVWFHNIENSKLRHNRVGIHRLFFEWIERFQQILLLLKKNMEKS